jgi:hypothetical protein
MVSQPTPLKPFEPVIGVNILDGMKVNPATRVNGTVAPELPDMNTLSVLSSPEKDSEPLREK